jgi:hypothetical protein
MNRGYRRLPFPIIDVSVIPSLMPPSLDHYRRHSFVTPSAIPHLYYNPHLPQRCTSSSFPIVEPTSSVSRLDNSCCLPMSSPSRFPRNNPCTFPGRQSSRRIKGESTSPPLDVQSTSSILLVGPTLPLFIAELTSSPFIVVSLRLPHVSLSTCSPRRHVPRRRSIIHTTSLFCPQRRHSPSSPRCVVSLSITIIDAAFIPPSTTSHSLCHRRLPCPTTTIHSKRRRSLSRGNKKPTAHE